MAPVAFLALAYVIATASVLAWAQGTGDADIDSESTLGEQNIRRQLIIISTTVNPLTGNETDPNVDPPVLVPTDGDLFQYAMDWSPIIGCLKENMGTSIKVTKGDNLEDFSLLIMNPPPMCSRDLGELRNDIIIPGECVDGQAVDVALQYTPMKEIRGGRYYRAFRFICSDLGSDGKVQVLSTDTNPQEADPTLKNTSYADGTFSVMVVSSQDITSETNLTSATSLKLGQEGAYLVIQQVLNVGSQHRTLIPIECSSSSTIHPDMMTLWSSRVGIDCERQAGVIGEWVIHPYLTGRSDVTYAPIFPFDFTAGERVTITCHFRECPYVEYAELLQGECKTSFDKFQACGGTFEDPLQNRRREVTSLDEPRSDLDVTTRVMSATFTLT